MPRARPAREPAAAVLISCAARMYPAQTEPHAVPRGRSKVRITCEIEVLGRHTEDPADATVYGLFGRSAISVRSTGPGHQFTHHTDQARAVGPRASFARGHQVPETRSSLGLSPPPLARILDDRDCIAHAEGEASSRIIDVSAHLLRCAHVSRINRATRGAERPVESSDCVLDRGAPAARTEVPE